VQNTSVETESQSHSPRTEMAVEKRELQIFRKYLERRGLKLTSERRAEFGRSGMGRVRTKGGYRPPWIQARLAVVQMTPTTEPLFPPVADPEIG